VVGGGQPTKVSMVPASFRIVGPMVFPAGLHWAHSVRFTVAAGIAMPNNSPGHSGVTCEVTGKAMKPGEICQ
jgi:hypothetical protein